MIFVRMDASKFQPKKAIGQKLYLARIGLGRALLALLADIINESPRPPIASGYLWASGVVIVENRVIYSGNGIMTAQGSKPVKQKSFRAPSGDAGNLSGIVGLNTPYAARMHEGIGVKYNLGPGSRQAGGVGPKFMESKVLRFGKKYIGIIAEAMRG